MILDRKILVLTGVFVMSFVLCYQLAFKKTLLLSEEVTQLEQNGVSLASLAELNLQLSQREKHADSILENNNLRNTTIQNGLLEYLNQQKDNSSIKIVEFGEPHRFENNNGTVVSYSFELSGDYNKLLDIVYGLEQNLNIGSLAFVSFYKSKNYRKRREVLKMKVIMQSLENN
ncbi:hypothetical protein [Gilvibacter sediminis]|uniref:hypothetical protein n=1 Tax=Gilvibacter sediminis TaxID=379071 RepID=UPI00234FB8D6|nr:hypothetical protein [Gilvibacter sediminis]MDC7996881.1 hypothetical protein [Gilvibacter sediminis]